MSNETDDRKQIEDYADGLRHTAQEHRGAGQYDAAQVIDRYADAHAPRGPYGAHAPAPSEPRRPGFIPPAPLPAPYVADPIVGAMFYTDGHASPVIDAERVARIVDASPLAPVSVSLQVQILDLCRRPGPYRIEALAVNNAPETLADLSHAMRGSVRTDPERREQRGCGTMRDHVGMHAGQRVPVSITHSTQTIWSAPEVNYLARAWHDSVHLSLGTAFDLEGELATARAQCAKIQGRPERRLLWIEVAGQSIMHDTLGRFPADQRGFVLRAFGKVQDGASMDDAIAFAIDHERKGGE